MRLSMVRSYGTSACRGRGAACGLRAHTCVDAGACCSTAGLSPALRSQAAAKPVKMVVLGDSLSAGLGLPAARCVSGAAAKGLAGQGDRGRYDNAGVSGDTASGGRDRLDWSVPDGTEAVIVELGANDALRGTDPDRHPRGAVRHRDAAEGAQDRGAAVRHAGAAELRQRLRRALQFDLSGSGEIFRRAALSVLPRRRRGRCQTQPGRRHAPDAPKASTSSSRTCCLR